MTEHAERLLAALPAEGELSLFRAGYNAGLPAWANRQTARELEEAGLVVIRPLGVRDWMLRRRTDASA